MRGLSPGGAKENVGEFFRPSGSGRTSLVFATHSLEAVKELSEARVRSSAAPPFCGCYSTAVGYGLARLTALQISSLDI